jgi:hypothetical protein
VASFQASPWPRLRASSTRARLVQQVGRPCTARADARPREREHQGQTRHALGCLAHEVARNDGPPSRPARGSWARRGPPPVDVESPSAVPVLRISSTTTRPAQVARP